MASIEARTSGNGYAWRVVWREDGIKQSERFASASDAKKFRALVEAHGNHWPPGWTPRHGLGSDTTPDDALTFGQFARATIAARSTANPRTRADYLRDLEQHLIPTFGDKPVDGITKRQVGVWLIALRSQVSAKTCKNIQGLASSIMADAIDAQLVGTNPFRGSMAALPAVRHEEMCFLTRPEFDELLTFVSTHYQPLTLCLALTGLRWSEATALGVFAIDLEQRRLTVSRAWKRTPESWYELGEPKSRRSRRTISIPRTLADALRPIVEDRDPSAFVFTTPQGRPLRHANYRARVWLPALDRWAAASGTAKRPRIHDLRHSHASWLIAAGLPLPAIQRRLGHESITTTVDRYGHIAPEMDDAISAALDIDPPDA